MKVFVIILLLICSVWGAGQGGLSPKVLTLKHAQEIALRNHPDIKSSRFRVASGKETVKEIFADKLPQITVNGVRAFSNNTSRILAPPVGITNSTVLDRAAYGVSASQLVLDFGRSGYLVDSAKFQAKALLEQSLSIRDRVLFEVTQAYYNVLRAQELLKVAIRTLKDRQLIYDQVNALEESFLKSELDVSIAKQTVEEAKLLILNAENFLDKSKADLSQALGYEDGFVFELVDDQTTSAPQITLKDALTQAKSKNPELNKLRADLAAAKSKYEAEKAANYPTLNAFGYAGNVPTRNKNILPSPHYAAAGVNLSYPLFTGGRLTASEEKAKFQKCAAYQDFVAKENVLTRDVRIAWNNVQTAYKNIDVSGEFLKTSNEALSLMQERYKIGLNSIVDLAQAELSQTKAEIGYANAKYQYYIDRAFLMFLMGVVLGKM